MLAKRNILKSQMPLITVAATAVLLTIIYLGYRGFVHSKCDSIFEQTAERVRGKLEFIKIKGELALGPQKVQELTESSQKVALHLKTCCVGQQAGILNTDQFQACMSSAKDYEVQIIQVATNIKEANAAEEQRKPELAKQKADAAKEAAGKVTNTEKTLAKTTEALFASTSVKGGAEGEPNNAIPQATIAKTAAEREPNNTIPQATIPETGAAIAGGVNSANYSDLSKFQYRDAKPAAKKEERVEIKYLVPEDNIETVSKNLHLDADHPSATRVICFYDTDSMTLFNHIPKAILRSRYSTDTDQQIGETTVKIRGGKLEGKDVKCEFDEVIGKDKLKSCSLTDETQKVEEIKAANKGADVEKIFSDEQEDFLNKAGIEVSWKTLTPFGPVEGVKVWKDISADGLDKVTVERWELPERAGKPKRILFEVSTKVPVSQAAQATTALSKVLGITGTEKQEEETKTKIVLEHFAKTTAEGVKP